MNIASMATLDPQDPRLLQGYMDSFVEKSVCDADRRHLGFVADVLVSSWNYQPLYLVLEAKLKPWHIRNATFYIPVNRIAQVDRVRVSVVDQRSHIYETSDFDPQVVEAREMFPMLSMKRLAENASRPSKIQHLNLVHPSLQTH